MEHVFILAVLLCSHVGGATADGVDSPRRPLPTAGPHDPARAFPQDLEKRLPSISGNALRTIARSDGDAPGRPGSADRSPKKRPGRSGRPARKWRFRIVLPQFTGLWGLDAGVLGLEQGIQLELYARHIIQTVFVMGALHGSTLIGGGVGYAYEWELLRNIIRLEFGTILGGFFMHEQEKGTSNEGVSLTFFLLRPVLHVGYKYFYFSIGPRLAIGIWVHYGFAAGFTIRM